MAGHRDWSDRRWLIAEMVAWQAWLSVGWVPFWGHPAGSKTRRNTRTANACHASVAGEEFVDCRFKRPPGLAGESAGIAVSH